jgi:hypothetical protein
MLTKSMLLLHSFVRNIGQFLRPDMLIVGLLVNKEIKENVGLISISRLLQNLGFPKSFKTFHRIQ